MMEEAALSGHGPGAAGGPGLPGRDTPAVPGSPLARAIDFRSGAVIAVTRLVLAMVFFLALWIDPSQPVRASPVGHALLAGYIALAGALVIVAWVSWWWDHRLASLAMTIDVAVFLAAVYFTEGPSDFASPFLAFFAFLMLAATIRWGWRATALVAVCATMLYLAVGLAMTIGAIAFDHHRFVRRTIYMIVLSLVLVWFALQRRDRLVGRFDGARAHAAGMAAFLDAAMAYAMAQCGARWAVIAWNDDEEPWTLLRARGIALSDARFGPGEYDAAARAEAPARLFDLARGRQLCWQAGGRPRAVQGAADEPLAALLAESEAVALPLSGPSGHGEMLLGGIPRPTTDHVEIAERLSREIATAFDRLAAAELVQATAVASTRDAVARDLHDSVAQALAGASFRLEALRSWIRAGHDPEPEIAAIKQALRTEQQHVRDLIARLRGMAEPDRAHALSESLPALAADLSRQWGIAVAAHAGDGIASVPGDLWYDLQQIVREAVANGVRHGGARHVTLETGVARQGIELTVRDDGSGFPPHRKDIMPWSLYGRVRSLGGSMAVSSVPGDTRIVIVLPMGDIR